MSQEPEMILAGMGVSPGVAIGRAVSIESRPTEVFRLPIPAADLEAEVGRLREAAQVAAGELELTRLKAGERVGEELATIFEAHRLMLQDRAFIERIAERIRDEQVNAEWAVHKITRDLLQRFEAVESLRQRERGEDLTDVAQYLLRALQGISHHELSEIEGDIVIVAQDLTPSEAIRLGREQVVGFAIETGGRTSHTTIIARSLHIPLVAGLEGVSDRVTDNDPVIVNGSAGNVILHPAAATLEDYRERAAREKAERRRPAAEIALPAVTRDGVAMALMANIDLPEEIDEAVECGAAGVGLYRSEFLYIERSPELPSEDDQVEMYRRLVEAMRPHPVVIRTYDLGGRKLAREMMATKEENPVMGLRGIRLTLARPQIFRIQLRALLRAATHGDLRILLPLVSVVDEVSEFKAFMASMRAELRSEGVEHSESYKLGVMIEVPSAVMVADELANQVDFLSIGTNDLIQYSMAADRNNEHVAYLYSAFQPAILRMIRAVVEAAERGRAELSICGEMAANPRCALLLAGLGLRKLSLSPGAIPDVKREIRGAILSEWQDIARRCLELPTAREVIELLDRVATGAAPVRGS